MHCRLDGIGGPCLPGLLHTRLHSERAVERYTALTHPTTVLQNSTAYTALYSVVYYTAIQLIQYTALYNHPLLQALTEYAGV